MPDTYVDGFAGNFDMFNLKMAPPKWLKAFLNTNTSWYNNSRPNSNISTPSPTDMPTLRPTRVPTKEPTSEPTVHPTLLPTSAPSESPTATPSAAPSNLPSASPTPNPSTIADNEDLQDRWKEEGRDQYGNLIARRRLRGSGTASDRRGYLRRRLTIVGGYVPGRVNNYTKQIEDYPARYQKNWYEEYFVDKTEASKKIRGHLTWTIPISLGACMAHISFLKFAKRRKWFKNGVPYSLRLPHLELEIFMVLCMGMLDVAFGVLTSREVPGPSLGYTCLASMYICLSILFVAVFIGTSWKFRRDTEYFPVANMVTFRPVPVKQNAFVTMQECVKKLIQAGHSEMAAIEMYKSMNRNVFGLVEYSVFRLAFAELMGTHGGKLVPHCVTFTDLTWWEKAINLVASSRLEAGKYYPRASSGLIEMDAWAGYYNTFTPGQIMYYFMSLIRSGVKLFGLHFLFPYTVVQGNVMIVMEVLALLVTFADPPYLLIAQSRAELVSALGRVVSMLLAAAPAWGLMDPQSSSSMMVNVQGFMLLSNLQCQLQPILGPLIKMFGMTLLIYAYKYAVNVHEIFFKPCPGGFERGDFVNLNRHADEYSPEIIKDLNYYYNLVKTMARAKARRRIMAARFPPEEQDEKDGPAQTQEVEDAARQPAIEMEEERLARLAAKAKGVKYVPPKKKTKSTTKKAAWWLKSVDPVQQTRDAYRAFAAKRGVEALDVPNFKDLVSKMMFDAKLPIPSDDDLNQAFILADDDDSGLVDEEEFVVLFQLIRNGKASGLSEKPKQGIWNLVPKVIFLRAERAEIARKTKEFKEAKSATEEQKAAKEKADEQAAEAAKAIAADEEVRREFREFCSKLEVAKKKEAKETHSDEDTIKAIKVDDLDSPDFYVLVNKMMAKRNAAIPSINDLSEAFILADDDDSGRVDEEEFVVLFRLISSGKVSGLSTNEKSFWDSLTFGTSKAKKFRDAKAKAEAKAAEDARRNEESLKNKDKGMFDEEEGDANEQGPMFHERILDWLLVKLEDPLQGDDTMAEDYVAPNRHLCNGRVGKVTGVCPSKLRWRFRDYKYRVSVEFEFGITLYLLAELNELGEPPDFSSAFTQLECSAREAEAALESVGSHQKGMRFGFGRTNFQSFAKHAVRPPKDHPQYQKRVKKYQQRSSPNSVRVAAAVTFVHTALFLLDRNLRLLWAAKDVKGAAAAKAGTEPRPNVAAAADEARDQFPAAADSQALREMMDPWNDDAAVAAREKPRAEDPRDGNPRPVPTTRARLKNRFDSAAAKYVPVKLSLNLAAPPLVPLRVFAKPRKPSKLAEWWRTFVLRRQGFTDHEHAPPPVRPDAKDAPKEVERMLILLGVEEAIQAKAKREVREALAAESAASDGGTGNVRPKRIPSDDSFVSMDLNRIPKISIPKHARSSRQSQGLVSKGTGTSV